MQTLQSNSLLQGGRYKIIKSLGQGGFGITYLAIQSGLERKVAIKEFFMKELCERDESTSHVTLGTEGSRETVNRFREKFLKEARNIAKLNHPYIVRIIDVFEENGTAYYVMEYAEGGSLADKVKNQGYLSEPVATRYILQVAEALSYIHKQKMNHLDVKPANIMLNEKDESVLIDFGLSKQYDATTGNQTSTTPVGISEGYAPMEQYKQGGVGAFSPETDIYALGATFFKLLTGTTPPSASDVNEDGVPVNELHAKGISQSAIDVICKAMEGRKKDRMHDVREFISALKGQGTTAIKQPKPEVDDEATVLTVESQKKEDERRRKEAEAKAAKEKAEAEARAKAEAEKVVREEAERKRKEEEEKAAQSKKKGSSKTILWVVIGIIAVVIASIGLNGLNSSGSSNTETTNQSSQAERQEISSQTFTANGVSFDMMLVKAGTFTMGATSEMKDPWDDEKPTHQVTLTNNYYIGKTEVTQALWKAVMGKSVSQIAQENGWDTYGVGDNYPMYDISWNDCKTFISKLNSATGKQFRMPTEAEWEFAARGGINSNHCQYSGSNNIDDVAWYCNNSGDNRLNLDNNTWDQNKVLNNHCKTHEVATKQPNELGIYDMSGNVWEWCSDYWGNYSSSAQTNPTGSNSGSLRVFRGGSWNFDAWGCRSSYRSGSDPDYRNDGLGLRLALSE